MPADRIKGAILISGRGSNMQALISASASPDFPVEFIAVVCDQPKAAGLTYAKNAGLKAKQIDHKNDPERCKFLRAEGVELICLAGYMRVLSSEFVSDWQGKILNIHPSLLPNYKGLDAQAQALAAGDTKSGASVHWVTADLDGGPLVDQIEVPIEKGDDVESLSARILEAEHLLYPRAIRGLFTR